MLPHETCGTHLDSRQRTIDYELEKKNFKSAGDILAEIWSKIELDGHLVGTEYVEKKEIDPIELNEIWMSNHCRTSKYFLKIVKCENIACCSRMRTNWSSVFPGRFLPPPVLVRKEKRGPTIPETSERKVTDHFAGLWQRIAISSIIKDDLAYDA